MQNKANLLNAQINVNTVLTKDYENVRLCRGAENKAKTNPKQTQSNPIKPKTNPIKANQSQFQTQSNPISPPEITIFKNSG